MPSFSDSIFLFVLALLLFGPKKLPVLARELGKWLGEFRRASNEFKMQMEEELRQSEQEDRQKQIAAMEAAAPVAQPVDSIPHPHLPETEPVVIEAAPPTDAAPEPMAESASEPLPIASSGELKIMPPATGLPTPRTRIEAKRNPEDPLGGLLEAIPSANGHEHGDNGHEHADNAHEQPDVALAAEGESGGR
jgi:sec-independent protein translocase protein TatB